MAIVLLLVSQTIVTIVGFALMWRRLDETRRELTRVRSLLETLQLARFSGAQVRRAQPARVEPAYAEAPVEPPAAWRSAPTTPQNENTPPSRRTVPSQRLLMANDEPDDAANPQITITPTRGRAIAAALALVAPALAFFFAAPVGAVVSAALAIAAALMLVALRPLWRECAWVTVLGAAVWAGCAVGLGAAETASFAVCAGAAAIAGLAFARLRGVAPGAALSLIGAAALLAIGAQSGLIAPAGIAYGAVVAAAALVGASSLRLEAVHVAALVGGGVGLFVLSGQDGAAIWFTPAIAWFGALFLAISLVRTPVLGARGLMLAATGAIAPMLAAGSLFASAHALADPGAAAAAFAVLAVIFSALLTVAAQRNGRGVAALHLTAWLLTGAALTALASAAFLALSAPLVAVVMAIAAVGLTALDWRTPDAVWRAAAIAAMIVAAAAAVVGATLSWPPLLFIGVAIATPAAVASLAALIAQRGTKLTASLFEAFAIAGALIGAALLIRVALGNGAPMGFIEAGAHIGLWLTAALALAARRHRGARSVRRGAIMLLGAGAVAAGAVATLLWLTPYWINRPMSGVAWPLLQHAPLGFALPAVAAWAHWVFWRSRGAHVRTRVAMAAATTLTAGFASLEIVGAREGFAPIGAPDWIGIAATLIAFALAAGINAAPGVTSEPSARLHFQKYFQRDRRSQQRV